MPTAAKLCAALWFALMGWLGANAHIPALGESPAIGHFREVMALLGLICGWTVMGAQTGRGYADSVGTGLKTAIILAFFGLFLFSGWQMLGESMRMRFDGPLEAMLGWVALMMENAQDMATAGVIGIMILAGFLGGPLAEWAWRRWQ